MTRVITCSVTAAGAAVAERLPYEHRHGQLAATVTELWPDVDAFVLIAATGIAVRVIAPLLATKEGDPAVLCVDDSARWVIPLTGGHAGGANTLAREVAGILGAEAVTTTATDNAGLAGLDTFPGFRATGAVAAVTRQWLDGDPPTLTVDADLAAWPLPAALRDIAPASESASASASAPASASNSAPGGSLVVTDRARAAEAHEVILRPPSLVVGVGSSSGADPAAMRDLVARTVAEAGLDLAAVGVVATIDLKEHEPAIVGLAAELGVPLRTFPAPVLASRDVPTPSEVVAAAVGTPSVAEAAALEAAGPGAQLVVTKQRSADATVAVARRRRPDGHLAVVGLGPGDPAMRTPAATAAVRHADVVIGYGPYIDLATDALSPRQEIVRSPIGAEADRCGEALDRAAAGEVVALVCSGDPGVFAMASLVCELAPSHGDPSVTIVPGVTAALTAAAVLGAPLGHDHASISLSDLLTPWEAIERRVRAVAEADMVVSFYNPRSQRRTTQLERALAILREHRPGTTPTAIVADAGRPGQRVVRTTLVDLDPSDVDMLSLVIVGSTTTRWIGARMVTPRGYQP